MIIPKTFQNQIGVTIAKITAESHYILCETNSVLGYLHSKQANVKEKGQKAQLTCKQWIEAMSRSFNICLLAVFLASKKSDIKPNSDLTWMFLRQHTVCMVCGSSEEYMHVHMGNLCFLPCHAIIIVKPFNRESVNSSSWCYLCVFFQEQLKCFKPCEAEKKVL